MPITIDGSGTITGVNASGGISSAQIVSASSITTGTLPKAQLPTGSVLQVVSTQKGDIFTSSAGSTWTDITGFSATITPTSSSNKILVLVNIGSTYGGNNTGFRLDRNGTVVGIGDANGSYPNNTRVGVGDINAVNQNGFPAFFSFLDSPATTSSTTYKVQFWMYSPGTFYFNCGAQVSNNNVFRFLAASSITLMEVAA